MDAVQDGVAGGRKQNKENRGGRGGGEGGVNFIITHIRKEVFIPPAVKSEA